MSAEDVVLFVAHPATLAAAIQAADAEWARNGFSDIVVEVDPASWIDVMIDAYAVRRFDASYNTPTKEWVCDYCEVRSTGDGECWHCGAPRRTATVAGTVKEPDTSKLVFYGQGGQLTICVRRRPLARVPEDVMRLAFLALATLACCNTTPTPQQEADYCRAVCGPHRTTLYRLTSGGEMECYCEGDAFDRDAGEDGAP